MARCKNAAHNNCTAAAAVVAGHRIALCVYARAMHPEWRQRLCGAVWHSDLLFFRPALRAPVLVRSRVRPCGRQDGAHNYDFYGYGTRIGTKHTISLWRYVFLVQCARII